MTRRFIPPAPEVVAALRLFAERRLSPAEFNAYVNAPMDEFEAEQIDALIRWFKRRYPTPAERLAYIRRSYEQARRRMPPEPGGD